MPTTDARALETGWPVDEIAGRRIDQKPDYDIDQRVRDERLSSTLHVFDTGSGELLRCERVPQAWITHVQFHPENPDWILYNHEWPGDCGIRRMWLWDGKQHRRLRTEGEGRSRHDWVCHEVWEKDGRGIIYHGGFHQGVSFVGRMNADGTSRTEISLPKSYRQYGHFTLGPTGALVSDGYYRDDDTGEGWAGEWISLQKVNWERGSIEWVPLCRHGSNWDSQDSHPHPIFNHAGDAVLFTSNRSGLRAIYQVNVDLPTAG